MFASEVRALLVEVISSWQVLAVTIALIIFVFIVSYAARTHSHYKPRGAFKGKKRKMKSQDAIPDSLSLTDSDDLGLEE